MVDRKSFETPEALRGKYRIQSLLGEGSQGRTWLGIRLADGKEVAIKELKYVDFKQIELFQREAEVMQSLDVKGVPRLYESIASEKGGLGPCYLTQEYVPYPTLLSQLESEGKFEEREVLRIMRSIGQILHELENHYVPPIIHRDIKPSNILYNRTGEGAEVYLIDFGAVANPQKQSGGSTIAGTFGYMAPEQLQGNATIQSDYYGLGATALHLLTGVSPSEMEADVFRLQFDDVLSQKAPRLSDEARELLHILMAPHIEDRPANASELIAMVKNVARGCLPKEIQKRGWLERFFDRLHEFFYSSPNNWPQCEGKIRGLETLSTSDGVLNVIQYTYTVKGRMYCGFFEDSQNTLTKINVMGEGVCPRNGKVKIDGCTVCYDSHNPNRCYLPEQTVYISKPILEKLFASHVSETPSTWTVVGFASNLWKEEQSAPHALFYVLAKILANDLMQYEEYRIEMQNYILESKMYIRAVVRKYYEFYSVNHDSNGNEARRLLEKVEKALAELPALPLKRELAEIWKTAQTMQWGEMGDLLRLTCNACKSVARVLPAIIPCLRDIFDCVKCTASLQRRFRIAVYTESNEGIEIRLREFLQDSWLQEIAATASLNVEYLKEPLQFLQRWFPRGGTQMEPKQNEKEDSHSTYYLPYNAGVAGSDTLTQGISLSRNLEIEGISYKNFLDYVEECNAFCIEYQSICEKYYSFYDEQTGVQSLIDLFAKRLAYLEKIFDDGKKKAGRVS